MWFVLSGVKRRKTSRSRFPLLVLLCFDARARAKPIFHARARALSFTMGRRLNVSDVTLSGDHAFQARTPAHAAADGDDAGAPAPAAKQLHEQQQLLKALTMRLKDTYRKVNPDRPLGCDLAPRRVLTHPSAPVANGCVQYHLSSAARRVKMRMRALLPRRVLVFFAHTCANLGIRASRRAHVRSTRGVRRVLCLV